SAWDYVFSYRFVSDGILPDGVPWNEAAKSLVRVLTRIEPGAVADLEVDAAKGALFGQDFDSDAHFFFPVASDAGGTPSHVPVTLDSGQWVFTPVSLAPGKVVFEIRNAGKLPVVFGILQLPTAAFERPKLRFMPSLSGKRLLMTQTFRDFF